MAYYCEMWRVDIREIANWLDDPRSAAEVLGESGLLDLVLLEGCPGDDETRKAARFIAEQPRLEHLPRILIGPIGKTGDAEAARALGFDNFLTHPIDRSHLFDTIVSLVATPSSTMISEELNTPAAPLAASDGVGTAVLIVEDNAVNQTVIVRMLEMLGYRADVASDGTEAVDAVRKKAYDLVLMDCQMPEMDGLEATRVIRLSEEGQGIRLPIIALTANAMSSDRESCIAAGMDDFLTKPIRKGNLRLALDRHLGSVASRTNGR